MDNTQCTLWLTHNEVIQVPDENIVSLRRNEQTYLCESSVISFALAFVSHFSCILTSFRITKMQRPDEEVDVEVPNFAIEQHILHITSPSYASHPCINISHFRAPRYSSSSSTTAACYATVK